MLVGDAEPLGGLVVKSHGVEDTAARVKERVTSRPGRGQDSGVDDVVEDRNSDVLDTNHEGRSAGVGRGSAKELGVVVGDENADEERRDTIEDGQTPDETTSSLGNVAPGSDSLTSSNRNQLRRCDESKSGADKGTPVGEEVTSRTLCTKLFKCARVFPV